MNSCPHPLTPPSHAPSPSAGSERQLNHYGAYGQSMGYGAYGARRLSSIGESPRRLQERAHCGRCLSAAAYPSYAHLATAGSERQLTGYGAYGQSMGYGAYGARRLSSIGE